MRSQRQTKKPIARTLRPGQAADSVSETPIDRLKMHRRGIERIAANPMREEMSGQRISSIKLDDVVPPSMTEACLLSRQIGQPGETGILDERKAMAIGDAPHLYHVGGMAVHVYRQQGACPWRDRGFASGCVDASCLRVDVDPDDGRTDRPDRRRSGEIGICNRDNFVSRPDPERA